jgi:hypothetical protein
MNRPEQPFKAMEPTGSVRLGYGTLVEKESSCAFPVMGNHWSSNNDITSRNRRVTDPYDRWCGGRRFNPSSYPISPLFDYRKNFASNPKTVSKTPIIQTQNLFCSYQELTVFFSSFGLNAFSESILANMKSLIRSTSWGFPRGC